MLDEENKLDKSDLSKLDQVDSSSNSEESNSCGTEGYSGDSDEENEANVDHKEMTDLINHGNLVWAPDVLGDQILAVVVDPGVPLNYQTWDGPVQIILPEDIKINLDYLNGSKCVVFASDDDQKWGWRLVKRESLQLHSPAQPSNPDGQSKDVDDP